MKNLETGPAGDAAAPGVNPGLEDRFDPVFVARLALREKQVQQSYRPIIGIHKWFARRPGSVFRALLLSEFANDPLDEAYWESHDLQQVIADPFMGGGTTVFEALRLGISAIGTDINPMAYWLVRQAVEGLDLDEFRAQALSIWNGIRTDVGDLYETKCVACGETAEAKYFLWVKTCPCPNCGDKVRLLPGYRIAEAVRHPREVFHCPNCEQLREIDSLEEKACTECGHDLSRGNTSRGRTECQSCNHQFVFAGHLSQPPEHHLFGLEYQCPACYSSLPGRQFKTPDGDDHARLADAERRLSDIASDLPIPGNEILIGDETARLHRWGYRRFQELFSSRQLLGLGLTARKIREVEDVRVRHALATVFSDFLRYQNLLCRYDTYALKCQDIFSVHGFPVALLACENNLPGIPRVGSGSFIHFIEKFIRAKKYAQEPYETRYENGRKKLLPMPTETIEAELVDSVPSPYSRQAWITSTPAQDLEFVPASLDGVFTDPPYFDNVQYAELMDFCFVWLRQILGDEVEAFRRDSTRTERELTGNDTLSRGLNHFTQGMSEVFQLISIALKPGAPLVFTFHHNDPDAYSPIIVSILDAGLVCTAVLPAPAEMTASLHIAGTNSSILDSIFVCRPRSSVSDTKRVAINGADVLEKVKEDVQLMAAADYSCSPGDSLCLRAGHIAAAAIRLLAENWDADLPIEDRLERARGAMFSLRVDNDATIG